MTCSRDDAGSLLIGALFCVSWKRRLNVRDSFFIVALQNAICTVELWMENFRRTTAFLLTALWLLWPGGEAGGQSFPTKPIRIIVGFAPAGAADIFARILGQKLTDAWGQTVVVENRPGAGSTIGSEIAAGAVPDGHTLLVISASYATSAGLYRKAIRYHPIDSFAPVTLIGSGANILLAHPSVAVKTVKELVAAAKVAPGKFTMGSAGTGSITHLAGELLASMAGVKLTHVPYKGGGPNMIALLGGEIQLTIASVPAALPALKGGRVRSLGVTSAKRVPALADVPTVAESGVPGYEALNWYGLLAPAGVPAAIISKLNGQINAILLMPDFIAALAREGAEPGGGTPAAFRKFLEAEIAKWTKVIETAGVKEQ
jgi:tripartite-type tricarboxylate transporter receptor subunit TctC